MTAHPQEPAGRRGPPPEGYVLRHPDEGDLRGAQDVLDAAETFDTGEPRRHADDLATEWSDPDCHIDADWWVVAAPTGRIVAVAWVWPETAGEVTADHYVHPEHRGHGLGDLLLDQIEDRAAELPTAGPDARRLVVWCEDTDVMRRAALDRRGFTPVRQYFEMVIDLTAPAAAATWPAGIEARRFRPGADERRVWAAAVEAFAEHHLYEARSFEEWRRYRLDATHADTSLWALAWAGQELAGFVIPVEGDQGATIENVAVRTPWRGRGIGRALLLTAFATLRERGQVVARLEVDAQNVTSAVRVYEAAGMRAARRFDVMRRPLV